MPADLNTTITITGSGEDLLAALDVLKMYESKHYKTKYVDAKLDYTHVTFKGSRKRLSEMKKRDREHIRDLGGDMEIEAGGPYGRFYPLEDTKVFENIADAAPSASFSGKISGFMGDADVEWTGKLKDGKLYLDFIETSTDDEPGAKYDEMLYEKLPPRVFADLFCIDKSGGALEDYYSEMTGALRDADFPNFAYNLFLRETGGMHISEEEYKRITQKARELGVQTMDEVVNGSIEKTVSSRVYDPVIKEYVLE